MNFLNYFLNAAYKIVYLYSWVEIYIETRFENFLKTPFAKNITNQVIKFKGNYFPECPAIQQYLFIENGNQIFVYKSLEKTEMTIFEPEHYDFVIRNDYRKNMNYKIIYNRFADNGDYIISSVSLLSFIVFYKDKVIDILLENNHYSFMIVGNKINSKFIYYLLKNMLKIDLPQPFEYTLQVVTHDVNILKLDSTQELVIGEKMVTIQNI